MPIELFWHFDTSTHLRIKYNIITSVLSFAIKQNV
jgi:hypothetical protein